MDVTHRMTATNVSVEEAFTFSRLEDGRIVVTIDQEPLKGGLRKRTTLFLTQPSLDLFYQSALEFRRNEEMYTLPYPQELAL